jgi:hypothetical protein
VLRITEDLPWAFVVSGIGEVSGEAAPGIDEVESLELRLRSAEPIRETAEGKLFLELSLVSREFAGVDPAVTAFDFMRRNADRDIGLSYAWDAVMVVGDRMYHLHAPCSLSKTHFDALVAKLGRLVAANPAAAPMLRCRCGGGCARTQ